MAFVQIEVISMLVRGEHDLREPVSIKVARCHSTTVIEVAVGEDVQPGRIFDAILEMHPGIAGGKQREETTVYWWGSCLTAGDFLLLLVAGACSAEVQRGKEIAEPQPQGRIHQLLTTLAHHGLLSEENRP